MITGYTIPEVKRLPIIDLQGILEADIEMKTEAQGGKTRKKQIYNYEIDVITKLKENYENADSLPGYRDTK